MKIPSVNDRAQEAPMREEEAEEGKDNIQMSLTKIENERAIDWARFGMGG